MEKERGACVLAVVIKDKKILLQRKIYKDESDGWKTIGGKRFFKPSKWGLPGGVREDDESDEEAVKREVKEETGVDVCPGKQRVMRKRENHDIIAIYCELRGGALRVSPDREVQWVSLSKVPSGRDMHPNHREMLKEMMADLGIDYY